MNATKQHGLIHLHMTVEEAKLLKALTGCIASGGEYGITVAHTPGADANDVRDVVTKTYFALPSFEGL